MGNQVLGNWRLRAVGLNGGSRRRAQGRRASWVSINYSDRWAFISPQGTRRSSETCGLEAVSSLTILHNRPVTTSRYNRCLSVPPLSVYHLSSSPSDRKSTRLNSSHVRISYAV